jgi:hypothetical protein
MKKWRLIIIGLLILISLGRVMPMTLMPEPEHPWYMPYTSWWWFAASSIFYPSVLFSHAIGLSFSNNAFLIIDALWLILLCFIIYWVPIPSVKIGSLEDDDGTNSL